MKLLCIIPARRDSKGIPGKNWKLLNEKPLISYSIELALQCKKIDTICVTTNSDEVIQISENLGVKPPFKRPELLALDTTSSYDVLIHALDFYENNHIHFDAILLLQPTSPFRELNFVNEAIDLFQKSDCEMVVSVNETSFNPYYNLYNESNGFLHRSIKSNFTRRQDCPPTYLVNGSIYVISVAALKQKQLHEMEKVIKYVIPEAYGLDLDTLEDWKKAEEFLKLHQ